jgi:hypothetical protein
MTDRRAQNRRYDAKRRAEKDSRGWYRSAAWAKRRKYQLAEHPMCAICEAQGVVRMDVIRGKDRMIVDHHPAHNEDYQAFFFGPIRTLCSHHHNTLAQQDEARGFSVDIGEDGWPTDPMHPQNTGATMPKNRNAKR